jgi:hypothetical protein
MKANIEKVKFWCFKVLPLVYDDSLSYYEVLCKVVKKLNEMVDALQELPEQLAEIEAAIAQLEQWIKDFDYDYISKWINEHLASMIFVEINMDGYFVVYIPSGWEDVTFRTSGWDEVLDPPLDYGHLILHY